MKAIWKDTVLAESNETILLENNHYFPAKSVNMQYLKESANTSTCPWKGHAKYYHVEVNGEQNDNSAWYYPEPKAAAEDIKGHIAFYKGVEIVTE
ncbi:DUF427 domain-containing protein [Litoribacter ruber]|uniref:DUF427 domain-containing protein n=1 Tax=Litoribacter ruber TaxID=702568 RepID=A0AAP2CKR0_9BACT|nr:MULTISPECIES: DUF427 domain-containing protein [Litoribacter]MBS9524325.1 DUF427 domain-containing protein [Litoribacter alkaliphilus]MBT0809875.1 DUF427 domain-containing protein [Litoribacter ruber]